MRECRICGAAAEHRTYVVREMMFGTRETFEYFQCGSCECLQIAEIPEHMERHYPASYYSFSHARPGLLRRLRLLLRRVFRAPYRPDFVRRLRLPATSRVLDVGCGDGRLLGILHECGFRDLRGIDAYLPEGVVSPPGVRLEKTDIFGVEGEFDFISFHHSLEHMADPVRVMIRVAERLSSTGHCLVRVPTVTSYAWETYGTDWAQLDAPRHFALHSHRSLRVLGERAGLELVDLVCDSTDFQFWASEQYRRDIPLMAAQSHFTNPAAAAFAPREIRAFQKRARELNEAGRGDQVQAYYRRKR